MRGLPRLLRPLPRRMALASVLTLLLGFGYAARSAGTPGERLRELLLADRYTAGRLSGQSAWQACAPVDTSALVPRVRCGTPLTPGTRRFRRVNDASHAVRREGEPSVEALRGGALLELRFADTASPALDRAVAALEQAVRLAPGDAGLLNDLAVTHLAIGERTQQLTPMLRALDAIERSAAADSLAPEILFNRALIQQRLYLIAGAEAAWARYLAVERDPRWRAEARAHARWVAQVPDTVSWDGLLATPPARMDSAARASIAARVRRSPQAARDSAFMVLGRWGRAAVEGDSAGAERYLSVAREIGAAANAMDADRSIHHAVQAIDAAAGQPDSRTALASAHGALAQGYASYYVSDFENAARWLARAETALRAAGSPAARWAAFYRGAAELNTGRFDSADHRFHRLFAEAPADEPALAGRTVWGRGVSQVRRGHYEAASRLYREAAPYSVRAREPENLAAISYLLSESLALGGQAQGSAHEALRGLRLLSPYRRSNFLNNHLTTVATAARSHGLSHAALALMNEVMEVAPSVGRADVVARAYRARARDLTALGRHGEALVDLTQALRWADGMSGAGGDRVRADVLLVLGQLVRSGNPAGALPLLAEVADTYRRVRIDLHVPVALYEAGLAAEAAGDLGGARPLFHEAVEYVERQQATFQSTESRATFHETIENVFDAMIRLELAAGRPDSAFAYLERARTAIQPLPGQAVGPAPPARPAIAALVAALPDGVLFVDYALLDDRVIVWAATRASQRHHEVPVGRDSMAALVERFRREAAEPDPARSPVRGLLYDLLLRPLEAEMEGSRRVVVVPDRELYHLPFAALWDSRGRRYVVQDAEITTVPSAAFYLAAREFPPRRGPAASALVVGNPALDRTLASQLPTLPGALREAEEVARIYPRHRLLTGSRAVRKSVEDLIPGHAIFHFAGHAVFNAEQPGLSYLALAPEQSSEDGMLRAWEIGGLRLSNVQVVVLSACSSLSARPTRAGAAAGLAYSFLRAGAPATVSTLWDVQDAATTPLLVAFHRRLAAGATPGAALRQAQLQALRAARAELQAPATWGGVIYTGP